VGIEFDIFAQLNIVEAWFWYTVFDFLTLVSLLIAVTTTGKGGIV
jgi:hypothetical protein